MNFEVKGKLQTPQNQKRKSKKIRNIIKTQKVTGIKIKVENKKKKLKINFQKMNQIK